MAIAQTQHDQTQHVYAEIVAIAQDKPDPDDIDHIVDGVLVPLL